MPDPEGKQLAGLARSIDALFSGGGRAVQSSVDEARVEADFVTDDWVETQPDVGPMSFVHQEAWGSDHESADGEDAAPWLDPAAQIDPAVEDDETVEFTAAVEHDPAVESALVVERDLVAEPDVHAEPDVFAEPDVLADHRSAGTSELDADRLVVAAASPIEVAVEAFLAGDRGQAAEIGRLAAAGLESVDLDPSERGLLRLAVAAGDPPDPDTLAVVEAIATAPVLARLVRRMGSERDEGRREEYFAACRTIGLPAAQAIRDDLAESTDRLARRVHCEAMTRMGAVSRPVIEEMAADQNRFLVRNAVRMLGEVGGEGAVELVTNALWNPDARVRLEALRALAKLGDADAGLIAAGLLDDSDPDVQIAAVVTVGELRTERALKALTGMLDAEKDHERCLPLLHALGQIGDPGAVPSIEKHAVRSLLSKPRADVRIAAYRALNQIGTPHARRLLNQAVSDKEPEVKAAVREMLGMR